MTKLHFIRAACAALMILTAAILTWPAAAAEKAGDVVSVRGKAVIERKTGKETARIASALQESDNVVTHDRARVKMLFRDDSILTLGPRSKLIIRKYLYSPESKRAESIYELADGRLRAVVGGKGFAVSTPTAFAAARGTVLLVAYDAETGTTSITVLEGLVEVRNINADVVGQQVVEAGQSTTIRLNKPPTAPVKADLASAGGTKVDLSFAGEGPEEFNLLGALLVLSGTNERMNKPIEQEPPHATTRVNMQLQF